MLLGFENFADPVLRYRLREWGLLRDGRSVAETSSTAETYSRSGIFVRRRLLTIERIAVTFGLAEGCRCESRPNGSDASSYSSRQPTATDGGHGSGSQCPRGAVLVRFCSLPSG